jgi:hemin uptake protein HemP
VRSTPQANSPNQEPAKSLPRDGRVVSDRLLGERGELVIEHNGREYRFAADPKRQLILTA